MAVTHHPHADWLLAYASGHMPSAQALATACHLSGCAICRQQLSSLNALGGGLLEQLPPTTLASDSWQKMLRRLEQDQAAPVAPVAVPLAASPRAGTGALPAPLHKLLPDGLPRKWTRLSTSLKQATLKELPDGTLIALHHIRAGGKVPQHTHEGTEITLVLNGSFSDQRGLYQDGDFLVVDETVDHTPTAVENEDCLCLTVQSAPLRLTGPIGRWFNPLIRALR
ncbi:MAG: ChrR family anti-sigma-E factor [Pseudomonadota bacterium]